MSKAFAPGREKEPPKKEGRVAAVSISTGLEIEETGSASAGNKKYRYKDQYGRAWLFPPDKLINGKVVYRCKYLGALPVQEPKGTDTVRDVVDRLKLMREVKGGTPLLEVDIAVSIQALVVFKADTNEIILRNPLHHISFCADDKRGRADVFSFIVRNKIKTREHVCHAFETQHKQAEDITTTIGQAFELAYERYQETRKAQEGFKQLKQKLLTEADKEDFTRQLAKLQQQVQEMEMESQQKERVPAEKFPTVVAQWESITGALQPYATEPSLDPRTLYLVPRPQTQELDSAISTMEAQLKDLEEGFSSPLQMARLQLKPTKKPDLAKHVMAAIEGQVHSMQLENEALEEPDLPSNYQMEEFRQARELPKKGTVKEASSQWEEKGQ